jgi:hypothetical protein
VDEASNRTLLSSEVAEVVNMRISKVRGIGTGVVRRDEMSWVFVQRSVCRRE